MYVFRIVRRRIIKSGGVCERAKDGGIGGFGGTSPSNYFEF